MRLMTGKGYRHRLEDNRYVDISIYPNRWTTTVNMSLWEEGNSQALSFYDKTYFNLERIFPKNWASKQSLKLLNRHSKKVAGIALFEK